MQKALEEEDYGEDEEEEKYEEIYAEKTQDYLAEMGGRNRMRQNYSAMEHNASSIGLKMGVNDTMAPEETNIF